jgi:hypothetical protein
MFTAKTENKESCHRGSKEVASQAGVVLEHAGNMQLQLLENVSLHTGRVGQ